MLNPRRWVEFILEPYPAGVTTTYRWSTRPLGGTTFVDGRIAVDGWGEIARRASSMTGEMNIDSASILIEDKDGMLRQLLDGVTTQWFKNREAAFKLLSEAGYASGLDPRIMFAGRCTNVQPADSRRANMEFEDLLAPYLDREYPQYVLGDLYPWRFTDEAQEIDEDLYEENPGLRIPMELREQVASIYYGPFIDTAVDAVTGLPRQKGMCPTFFMGYTFLSAGTGSTPFPSPEVAAILAGAYEDPVGGWGGWGEFFCGLGEIDITNMYASNLAEENPQRILVDPSWYGVTFLAPGHPGWPFPTDYVIRNGFRCTVVYVRGPQQWHHITGVVNITFDTCGWKNSDGDSIDQAGFIWQSFLCEHVLAHDGAGYTSGPEVGVPNFAAGHPMIWTDKVQEFQELTVSWLGTLKGYLNSMPLVKKYTLRTILQIWHTTNFAFTAKNAAGQLYPFGLNDRANLDFAIPLREFIELKRLPAPQLLWNDLRNTIDYTVGWDPEQDAPRTTVLNVHDGVSIAALKDRQRRDVYKATYGLDYTADDATASDSISRRLEFLKERPLAQALELRMPGVDIEIGDIVSVSHRDGLGQMGVGYFERPMMVFDHIVSKHDTTLLAIDLQRLYASAFPPLADITSGGSVDQFQGVWSSATAYSQSDIVTHSGSTWVAIRYPLTGEEPGVSTAWVEVLESAADGWFVLGDVTSPLPPPIGAYSLR